MHHQVKKMFLQLQTASACLDSESKVPKVTLMFIKPVFVLRSQDEGDNSEQLIKCLFQRKTGNLNNKISSQPPELLLKLHIKLISVRKQT